MLYFDYGSLLKCGEPFNIIIGGRGTGKTYGALKTCYQHYLDTGRQFIYMRRTQTEVDFITKVESANPFFKLNEDCGWQVNVVKIDKRLATLSVDGKTCGYIFALTTVSTIRGIDMSNVDYLVYDEFIPEPHVKRLKNEGMAFFNAYESFNRNREFEGKNPIYAFLLANSNDFNSDLLISAGLQKKCEEMMRKGKSFSRNARKRCTISLLKNNDFIEKKAETVLYQFTMDSDFFKMSINNEFVENDFTKIKSLNVKNMKIVCAIGNIYIYSDNKIYYASRMVQHTLAYFDKNDAGVMAFRKQYSLILTKAYIYDYLIFENFEIKREIVNIIFGKNI